MDQTPSETETDAEATEAAIADFYARIPEAVRDLVRIYVVTGDPVVRHRLRGRIDALLDYVEGDQRAGLPPQPSGWQRTVVEAFGLLLPMLAQLQDIPPIYTDEPPPDDGEDEETS